MSNVTMHYKGQDYSVPRMIRDDFEEIHRENTRLRSLDKSERALNLAEQGALPEFGMESFVIQYRGEKYLVPAAIGTAFLRMEGQLSAINPSPIFGSCALQEEAIRSAPPIEVHVHIHQHP